MANDPTSAAETTNRAALLLWAADQIDAETRQAKAAGVLEPDKFRPCRDASAQLRALAGCASCEVGVEHDVHCPTPESHGWGCGCLTGPSRVAAEEQPTETQDGTDLADRLEAALTERFTELGNPFSEMRRREQGPDGWPASHPVGPHQVAEVLRELMADETPAALPAVGEQPDTQTREADRIVAYTPTTRTELHCLPCTPNPAGDIWTPVTAEELDDGGICTVCGRDVLITVEADRG